MQDALIGILNLTAEPSTWFESLLSELIQPSRKSIQLQAELQASGEMASDIGAKLPDFDHVPQPYSGLSKEEVLKQRKEHLSPALFHYYKEPIMVVEGKMQVRHKNRKKWSLFAILKGAPYLPTIRSGQTLMISIRYYS